MGLRLIIYIPLSNWITLSLAARQTFRARAPTAKETPCTSS